MCSINSSANHQPAIVAVAQHGSLDDCSYVSYLFENSSLFILTFLKKVYSSMKFITTLSLM